MNAYFVCFIYTFVEKLPQKGAYPLHIPISNDCIYARSPSYFISNSEIFIKDIILDLYNDLLYLAPLKSLFGPFSLFDIIKLHAFYAGQ